MPWLYSVLQWSVDHSSSVPCYCTKSIAFLPLNNVESCILVITCVAGLWPASLNWYIYIYSTLCNTSLTASITAHTTCLSCGAATPVQIVLDNEEEFLKNMNSKVLAHLLTAFELIPEAVECDILQSKSREEANGHLLNHLKEDTDEMSVMELFRIASEMTGYGKMITFAADVLRKFRGVYWCVQTYNAVIAVQDKCLYKKHA